MKRNFLLMLLLTLLPFAGWAVDVTVGTYSVTLDKQYIAVGATVPTVSKVKSGETNVTFSQISVVKSDKVTEVASITLPGIYYKVVKANVTADTYDKLLVPFYAGEVIPYEIIDSEESFVASNAESKALNLYYAACLAEVEKSTADPKTYRDGTEADWIRERDNWSWAASKDFPSYATGNRFPMIGITAPLSSDGFKPAFIYTGALGTYSQSTYDGGDFVGDEDGALFATPWGATEFGTGDEQKKWGIASTNDLYGTGYLNAEEEYTVDKPKTTFDKEKFTAIWIPSDLNLASADVAVAPVTFSKIKIMARVFHVPFGTDVTGNDVTPDMFTILSVGTGICSEVELAASGLLKFVYLDGENTKVSIYGHPFKIEYNGEPFEHTTASGEEPGTSQTTTTYEIVVVTDQNTMYFDATPNSFMEGQIPTVVSSDLTYNAEAQNLISSTGRTMFVHADETASNVKYLVVTADKVIPDNGETTQPVEPTQPVDPAPQPDPDPSSSSDPGSDTPSQTTPEKFKLNYEPAASEWTDDATATDVAYAGEGAERQIDYYYVFAKASAGIGEAEGWTEGKTVEYIGRVKMQKADPTLAFVDGCVDEKYFKKSGGPKGLHKAIEPAVTLTVPNGEGVKDITAKYGEEVFYMVYTQIEGAYKNGKNINNWTCEATGNYRIVALIHENDNINAINVSTSGRPQVDFTVVRPKVTVTATATDVPYNNAPTFGYTVSNWEGDFTEFVVGDPVYTLYDANGNEVHKEGINGSEGYPSGTWTVKVSGLRVVSTVADPTATPPVSEVEGDHEITYVSGSITIGKADIVAKIADQNLIYGQALPVKLQHVDGLTGQQAASEFEAKTTWEFFKATLVDKDTHEPILDDKGKEQATPIKSGDLLDAGTYRVTCSGESFSMPGALNQFNVIAGAGYWTVAPKNLDNSDSRFNQNVNNIQNFWNPQNRPSVTYTGEPVLPNLSVITYNGVALKADIPAKPATYYAEGDDIPEGNKVGDENTPAEPAVAQDYSVEVLSAGGNIHAANNVQIRLTGHGNYTGTRTLAYNIKKKAIRVLPVEAEWVCGSDEVVEGESIYDIDWVDLFSKLVPADKKNNAFLVETATKTEGEGEDAKEVTYIKTNNLKKQNGFSSLAVRRLTGPNVGTFNNGIQAYLPENATPKAQDYDFTPGTGKVVITPGTIALKVNPNMKAEYAGKGAYPLTAGEFVLDAANSTLGEFYVEDDNWKQLVDGIQTTGELGWTYPQLSETVTRFNVGDEYRISIGTNAANSMSSTNYEIVITPDVEGGEIASANVEITPAPITLKSADQGPYDFEKLADQFVTTTDQITATTLKGEDELSDLVNFDEEELTGAVSYDPATVTTGENEDAIDITTKANGNYTVTKDKGTLTVNLAANLILYSNMETEYEVVEGVNQVKGELGDKDKITKWNGKPTDKVFLYLKAPKLIKDEKEYPAYSEWKANEWHALVLPFSVKIRDLSNAFGYAIVNVVDPEKTTENDVRFKLVNISYTADAAIPANTPFCVKTDEDFDFEEALVFDGKDPITVEKPIEWTVGVNAGLGYHFEGTYEPLEITKDQSYLRFLGTGSKWAYVGKEGTTYYMQPYTGYVNLQSFADTREVTFTFEEADGSTTSIKAVDFMNGKNSANAEGLYRVDGIKLQSAPTQKGVYVQDGKKFVK